MSVRVRDAIAGFAAVAILGLWPSRPRAQSPVTLAPQLLQELQWRNLGPAGSGHATSVSGQAAQPNVLYLGAAGGGLWKTTDYGRTWQPLFDREATGLIGAVAVAPSDANIIYVGTGIAMSGSRPAAGAGLFKSSDAGRTWTRVGFAESDAIPRIAVDARDPNRLIVAVAGDPGVAGSPRGVYRSTNGGRTFERVLFRDERTGAATLAFDPRDSNTAYAALCSEQADAGASAASSAPPGGLFKSTDGGATWHQAGRGLPLADCALGDVSLSIAPVASQRLFAATRAGEASGLYRSDDAGETWTRLQATSLTFDAAAAAGVVASDPQNADVVYYAGRAIWKSTDGGRTFASADASEAGAFEDIWINPDRPGVIALAGDHGGRITVNGGQTWNATAEPTSRFDRITADAAFPYRLCGEGGSGLVCAGSTNTGVRVETPLGPLGSDAAEVAPDPADPDVIYAGAVTRYDRRTGQSQDISPPRDADTRVSMPAPLLFAPADTRTLYFGSNALWKTMNGGQTWTRVSPDLTSASAPADAANGPARAVLPRAGRGAISALALSTIDARVIWAGVDNGAVQVTRDAGATWTNVTPSATATGAAIASIETSHFDTNSAYIVVHTRDGARPHVLRTRDGGQTWSEIVTGLPVRSSVNVVREDPIRRGLLFAATDQSVFFSFDDGNTWQALRLNLPPVPVNSLIVKDTDLAIATGGRGFWILDDLMPLRQLTDDVLRAEAFIFRPPTAWRTRAPAPDSGTSAARLPMVGVPFTYFIGANARSPVTIEILDTFTGELLRRFSSEPAAVDDAAGSDADTPRLSTAPGVHRFMWDLRCAPLPPFPAAAGRSSVPPAGRLASPGTYQVRFTVAGRVTRQAVLIKLDPRVRTPPADLTLQAKLSKSVDDMVRQLWTTRGDIVRQTAASTSSTAASTATTLATVDAAAAALMDVLTTLQAADVRPTAAVEAATAAALTRGTAAIEAAR